MAFVSDLFDQLRDLLNDTTDAQVAFATKKLYLNRGIARLWPAVARVVSDSSIVIVADTYIYTLPVALSDGLLLSVEIESKDAYVRLSGYDVIPGDEDLAGLLVLPGLLPKAGRIIRLRYAAPVSQIAAVSYVAAQTEAWAGPDRALGLPVLYAMGMASARKLDDRQDTTRYSTTQARNGVSDGGIMGASQMWFGQFEAELAEMERPLPPARD